MEKRGVVVGIPKMTGLQWVYQGTVTGFKAWREARAYYGSFSEPGEGVEERLYDAAVAAEALKAGFVEVAGRLSSRRRWQRG